MVITLTIVLKDQTPSKRVLSQQVPGESLTQQPHLTYSASKDILCEVDADYLPILAKKIKKYFDDKNKERQNDGKIHIFEITDCLRKALLVKKHADEIQNDIYDYMNLIQGLLSESKLVEILAYDQKASSTEYQRDIDFDGISAHPDYTETGDVEYVFELKSTNKIKPLILSDDTVKGYIRQVVYYMILMNIERGRILVRYNLPHFPDYVGKEIDETTGVEESIYKLKYHKDTGQFPFFAIRLHLPLQAPIREYAKKSLIDIIKPVYQTGDPELIPPLEGMREGVNWKCNNYCKVLEQCKALGDKQTDINKRYVLLNKHIDDSVNRVRYFGRKNKNVPLD